MKERNEYNIVYIALADLSNTSNAATVHSKEDVDNLRRIGWNVTFYSQSNGKNDNSNQNDSILCKNSPFYYRVIFECLLIKEIIFKRKKIDFVIFRGPSTLIFVGIMLKLLHLPFGLELNGVFQYRERKYKGRSLKHGIVKISDKYFMRHSKILIAVTRQLREIAIAESDPTAIVCEAPNGANIDKFSPADVGNRTGTTNYEDIIVLGYIGALYGGRGIELCIEIVKNIVDLGIDARLVVIGDGPLRNRFEEHAYKLGMSEYVHFTGNIPPELISVIFAQCTFGMAIFEATERIGLSGGSPLKLWTYLALGKPVIFFDAGVMTEYRDIPGVFPIDDLNSLNISKYIICILQEYGREKLSEIGSMGRKYVLENRTWHDHAKIISNALVEYFHDIEGVGRHDDYER